MSRSGAVNALAVDPSYETMMPVALAECSDDPGSCLILQKDLNS